MANASPRSETSAIEAPLAHAIALYREGRHEDALPELERCLAEVPDHPRAQLHAGLVNFELGRWPRGVAHLRVAVAAQPQFAEAWAHLALGLRALGQAGPARAAAQRAVALQAGLAVAWNALGLVEQDEQRVDEARRHFVQALALEPGFALARLNLANLDQSLGRVDEAAAGYREALALDPRSPLAHYNLGHLHHKWTGRMDEAIGHYRDALALRGDFPLAHHNLSHALFLVGQFDDAWREHAWRPPRLGYAAHPARGGRAYAPPAPDGIAGTRLVVVAEQGLGDVLFFLRYAPLLRARGAALDFAGNTRLHGMLARSGLFAELAEDPAALLRDGAREVLAGDLPLMAGGAGAGFPPPLRLVPDPARLEAMRAKLRALGPAPYVALAWRAGETTGARYRALFKEVPVAAMGAALCGIEATWLSVQREPHAGEVEALAAALGQPVHDVSSMNHDLEDALAMMALADGYAGVSSTNVHLRAGAGGAAQVLVPFPYEWRWMAEGASPWFPGIGVQRQPRTLEWRAALQATARGLRETLARR